MSEPPPWARRYQGSGVLRWAPYPPTLDGTPHRESCTIFWNEGDGYWTSHMGTPRRLQAECTCDLGHGVDSLAERSAR